MTNQELQNYIQSLVSGLPLERYIERRFTAVAETGGVPSEVEHSFRGMLRDLKPTISEIVEHKRVLILAEPGGGKSVAAKVAVHRFAEKTCCAPIFCQLKTYTDNLNGLLALAAPPEFLDTKASVDGIPLSRAYILDGIDEIPNGLLPRFSSDLQDLFRSDPTASVFLTVRQAYYAAHRELLPSITSLFHILDFSDKDIAAFLEKSNVSVEAFFTAVRNANALEEVRNPFILSVMTEKYAAEGSLSDRRSENLSYMIERLIQSRPRANRHQQRRVLKMLGVALETYSRNALTEEEAFAIIKQAMRISDVEARALLEELYASILTRSANGLSFQMRSYGEYLAAEALEDESLNRIKELAFIGYDTPNDSWINTISYLVELNSEVRAYFVRNYPLWVISASPAAFSDEEKREIVNGALQSCVNENQYVLRHPLINVFRLSRLIPNSMETALLESLSLPDEVVRGNAIVLLAMLRRPEVVPVALAILRDKSCVLDLRQCAVVALVNAGSPAVVPELLAMLDPKDDINVNLLDAIGALVNESQLHDVLPLIFRENTMLSSTFYHFREFNSRDAVRQILLYFLANPSELNVDRADVYIEPILDILPKFFDDEMANLCAELLNSIEKQQIYTLHGSVVPKLFSAMREADPTGRISRLFLARVLENGGRQGSPNYEVDRVLVSLLTPETAQWLIDEGATELIKEIAPRCRGRLREMFSPYSGGLIPAQDANAKAYLEEDAKEKESRNRKIAAVQRRLVSRTSLNDALKDFWELKMDYWPELPEAFHSWLATEISKQMTALDLRNSIKWTENTLWEPSILGFLLNLIDRYALRIEPDEPLVFVLTASDTVVVSKYHKRHPLSGAALRTLERLLENQTSHRAIEGIVRFLQASEVWSSEIQKSLKNWVLSNATDAAQLQVSALNLLAVHGVDAAFVVDVGRTTANQDVRSRAIELLVELGHRATIERLLSNLSDDDLRAGNVPFPESTPLGWLARIKSEFAWHKLAALRARALQLELPTLVGIVTTVLANIDRARVAKLIRQQIDIAPPMWRQAQTIHAITQERTARIEAAQRTPFDVVLRKLKGSTSINRLKVLCEGKTDRPVFRSLLGQIEGTADIVFALVGGWGNLRAEVDPNSWLLGCKEAIIVMDGDEGRLLTKHRKPYTKIAKEETKKFEGYPIELRILERYGIENYFPQNILEKVVGIDLADYFPIPDHVSVVEHLAVNSKRWKYRVRKLVARMFNLQAPSFGKSHYSKGRNSDVADLLSLADVSGTDLLEIVHHIGTQANRLSNE